MMKYDKNTVPNGFYTLEKPGTDYNKSIVHVMEVAGRRVVSFINRDYPISLKNIPVDVVFSQGPITSNFNISPEEITGREEELMAYLLESLCEDPNLQVSRNDTSLCISRLGNGGKRFYFILSTTLDSIEEP